VALMGRLKAILAGFGLFFTLLAASWFGGRKAGILDANARRVAARLDAAREAREIENEVEALDPDTLKQRAARWVRNPDR
jgi:hypothetical protein